MSLKAKIEAVIYASEEPVTLAQLTGLLGEEGQTELDAIAAQQHSLALEDEELTADESASDSSATEPVEDADALNAEVTEDAPTETPEAEAAAVETATPDEPALAPVNAELAEKKLARYAAAEVKARERKLRDYFRSLLEELIADYANGDRGLEIREVAGGFRLGTKPEYHDAVRGFVKSLKPPLKLSLQALETLAVVAYKQPVTAPEVSEIRGVDSAGVLGSLLTRKLVTTAGRKQVIGRPILYKTTKEFLLRFGLKDVNELPSIEEFEKMATELAETEEEGPIAPGEEEIPFAQNEISEIEEAEAAGNPGQPAPPMDDPEPEEPEPPIGEPPAEPEPAPTSEHDVAEHAEKSHS